MSETETRDEPMSEVEVSALLADARRHLRTGTGCGSCVKGVERLVSSLGAARAESERLTHLLGSHADGHRCTCTCTDPGKPGIEPDTWEQDPWCPTHPDVDYIRSEFDRLRGVVEAVQALAGRWEEALSDGCPACGPVDDCDHIEGYHYALSQLRVLSASVPSSGEVGPLVIDLRGSRVHGWFSVPEDAGPVTIRNVTFQPCSDCTHERPSSGEAESGEAGAWVHTTDGSECGEQFPPGHRFGSKERTPDGQLWWCTTHQSHLRWSPAPVVSGGQADGEGEHLFVRDLRRHPNGEVRLYDDGRLISGTFAYQVLPDLAARPVLSREAVRERLEGHRLRHSGCTCGRWWASPAVDGMVVDQWRDHLAAVLVGQEGR